MMRLKNASSNVANYLLNEGKEIGSLAGNIFVPYAHVQGLCNAASIIAVEEICCNECRVEFHDQLDVAGFTGIPELVD